MPCLLARCAWWWFVLCMYLFAMPCAVFAPRGLSRIAVIPVILVCDVLCDGMIPCIMILFYTSLQVITIWLPITTLEHHSISVISTIAYILHL
ncbi:hypothetical protein F5Y12DRAFT_336773 [Xylaria sp. FL1777]|nr:hypothetical protein F5Y12DRAFT_336773 [Xylaria sp. FL1777]